MTRYASAALGAFVLFGFIVALFLFRGDGLERRQRGGVEQPPRAGGKESAEPPPLVAPPPPRTGTDRATGVDPAAESPTGTDDGGGPLPVSPGTASLIFEILDGADLPLSDATVEILAGRQSDSRTTGKNGLAAFRGIAEGVYTYRVDCRDLPTLVSAREVLLGPGEERSLVLRIGAFNLNIAGTVKDGDGRPLGGIPVRARAQIYDSAEETLLLADRWGLSSESDAEGQYEIRGLDERDYIVSVEGVPGYPTVQKIFRAGAQSADLVLVPLRTIEILGTVTSPGGNPIPGALVVPVGQVFRQTTTGTDGRYSIQLDIDEDQTVYVLTASKDGYRQARLNLRADQFGEAEAWEVEISMEPLGARVPVSGLLRDAEGDPVPGETVYLQSPSLNARYQATSGPDGAFSVNDVQVGTDYRLMVYPKKPFKDAWLQDLSRTGIVVPEEGLALDVILQRVETGTLQGVMTDPEGAPIPRYTLWLRSMKALGNSQSVVGDASGAFRLEGVPEGEIVLETRSTPYMSLRGIRMRPGEEQTVTLVLDWGPHVLEGIVYGEGEAAIQGARLSLRWSHEKDGVLSTSSRNSISDAEGRFSFSELGAGEHRLIASSPGYLQAQIHVQVGAGGPPTAVRLKPAAPARE